MEKLGDYKFEIIQEGRNHDVQRWFYVIYHSSFLPKGYMKKTKEYFYSEQQARYAAIGHITILEKESSNV